MSTGHPVPKESAVQVAWMCIICGILTKKEDGYSLTPVPPYCDDCCQALKEIILEKRNIKSYE